MINFLSEPLCCIILDVFGLHNLFFLPTRYSLGIEGRNFNRFPPDIFAGSLILHVVDVDGKLVHNNSPCGVCR